jgi:hypothetical protein
MTPFTSAQVLDAWERALPLPPTRRPLALLTAATAGRAEVTSLAELPIGVRDGQLLELLETTFGPGLEAVATCPACDERLEVACTTPQIRAGPPRDPDPIMVDGYELRVRPPNSQDLAAVAAQADPDLACLELLRRCVDVLAGPDGAAATVSSLPAPVVEAVEEAMLAADPQAEVVLAIDCPACGYRWHATLDISAFLWTRIDTYARRCAAEVHSLARAYGWREADILAMSPWRRALYLQQVAP